MSYLKTLILSCNTGEGHNSCANAIKEVYDENGEECVICDALSFISKKFSDFICGWHIRIYRYMPDLFRATYSIMERHPSTMSDTSLIYKLLSQGVDKLYEYIKENGYESVICTHVFSALMITELERRYSLDIRTAFVATDYTCSPGVKSSKLDVYFIPNEELYSEFESDHISRENAIPSGIPIRQMFYQDTDKRIAKEYFDIPSGSKHIVVMCGSMGCGAIRQLAAKVYAELHPNWDMTIICGTNDKLKNRLERRYTGNERMHIRGYVKDMSLVMDSADLYLTKPGGISVTEAACKGLPMVFIDTVSACEKYNKIWFVNLGCAKTHKNLNTLSSDCITAMGDESILENMRASFPERYKNNAAEVIYRSMKGQFDERICS